MFTLAHLSDPHLGPIPTPRLAEIINKRGLGLINWYRRRHRHHSRAVLDAIVRDMHAQAPGHIAVTGDLVNISLDQEFANAARWLDQVGTPQNVTLVPGNHDAYIRRVAGHAARHWGEYMRGDDDTRRHPEEPSGARPRREAASFEARGEEPLAPQDDVVFPFVRRRGPVAIIGLTTSLPTGPLMATGRLGPDQLARLAEILITLAREPVFRVVLIHHPPIPNRGHTMKRLIDGPVFRALLAEHGAELLLHGHNHEQQLMWLDGPRGRIPAVGVPSASAIISDHDEPAAYNMYRIAGGPGAWQCDMVSRGLRAGHTGVTDLTHHTLIG
jgi:3',5'-cyclic AMP phosphodiesterase CpdA